MSPGACGSVASYGVAVRIPVHTAVPDDEIATVTARGCDLEGCAAKAIVLRSAGPFHGEHTVTPWANGERIHRVEIHQADGGMVAMGSLLEVLPA